MNANKASWHYNYRFSRTDCDEEGNILYSSMFRFAELAREQWFHESVEGYSDLLKNGLQVLIADSQFNFRTSFLPFDQVTCTITVVEIAEAKAAMRFRFLKLGSSQTCAETTQVIRFANSKGNSIYVPGLVRQAMTPLLETRNSASKLAAAG